MDDNLTIDGPEPSGNNKKKITVTKNVHIESLFLMAKYDPAFKTKLLTARETALRETELPFSPSERVLLNGISTKALEKYIDTFEIKGIHKKSLRNWANAAAVLLLVSTLLTSCGSDSTLKLSDPINGITQDTTETEIIKGINPDSSN